MSGQSLNLTNRFKILSEDEESIVHSTEAVLNTEVTQINFSKDEINPQNMNLTDNKDKKKSKKVEGKRRSTKTAEENKDVDHLLMFLEEIQIWETPSHQLKKCKFCKHCKDCCKLRRKCHSRRKEPSEKKQVEKNQVKLCSNILKLVKEKISFWKTMRISLSMKK